MRPCQSAVRLRLRVRLRVRVRVRVKVRVRLRLRLRVRLRLTGTRPLHSDAAPSARVSRRQSIASRYWPGA